MNSRLKILVQRIVPQQVQNPLIDYYVSHVLPKKGISVKKYPMFFEIRKQPNKIIRISRQHNRYLPDILNSFEYYFRAVKCLNFNGIQLVDYSLPRFHEVIGYTDQPIIFPSFAEPVSTTNQYLAFAQLKEGSQVLDLGAYSGLTSILFDKKVGKTGRVIAVDADKTNIISIKKNLELYKRMNGKLINLLEGAVWDHTKGLLFSNEGNMGSSALIEEGSRHNKAIKVSSYTLSSIVNKFHLKSVDFIKCDIEGAESVIFNDGVFFKNNFPKIIIETHFIKGVSTTQSCIQQLSKYGYQFQKIAQHGVSLPLLKCWIKNKTKQK